MSEFNKINFSVKWKLVRKGILKYLLNFYYIIKVYLFYLFIYLIKKKWYNVIFKIKYVLFVFFVVN